MLDLQLALPSPATLAGDGGGTGRSRYRRTRGREVPTIRRIAPRGRRGYFAGMATTVPPPLGDTEDVERAQASLRDAGVEYCLSRLRRRPRRAEGEGRADRPLRADDAAAPSSSPAPRSTGSARRPADDELSLRPDLDAITILPWQPRRRVGARLPAPPRRAVPDVQPRRC